MQIDREKVFGDFYFYRKTTEMTKTRRGDVVVGRQNYTVAEEKKKRGTLKGAVPFSAMF